MASRNTKRIIRGIVLHTILISGSVLFSLPFLWLFSTSFKSPDEMYPPKWIPQIPDGVVASPYIAIRPNRRVQRPTSTSVEDWQRSRPAVMSALKESLMARSEELPDLYRPYLDAPELSEAVFYRLIGRAPDDLFEKTPDFVAAWFVERVDDTTILDSFESVYRRLAVADVTIHGWDGLDVERPTQGHAYPWQTASPNARLVRRDEGLYRPAIEVQYSFREERDFALSIEVPTQMDADSLKKVTVSIHGDRSWHEVDAAIELDGRRWESTRSAFIGSDTWQDITWQVPSAEDDALRIRNWEPLALSDVPADVAPGMMRVDLRFRYAPRVTATVNKFSNPYRQVFSMVPLWTYVYNSVLLVALNITGQVLGSSLVAFAFARLRWPGRDFCFVMVLATLMIPPQVTMIPVFLIFRQVGWYNTLQPLWVPSFAGAAFFIFLLRQFMRGIPADLEDSAKIDGCGYAGIYARIILPLVRPALATIGIFTFMNVWNDFMGPLIYLSDQELYPLSLGLFALQTFQASNFALMMAASVLMTLPVIALFFLAQRQFIQGIALTGMKG